MKENLISLPSGMIINFSNVAFTECRKRGRIRLSFNVQDRDGGGLIEHDLDSDDARALIEELSRKGVDVASLWKNTGIEATPVIEPRPEPIV